MNRREFLFGRHALSDKAQEAISDESGASAMEYGLIGALMAVGLIGALTATGKATRRNLNCVKRAIKGKDANKFCAKRGA